MAQTSVPTKLSVKDPETKQPNWVTDDTIFPLYLVVLLEWIAENPAYELLIKRGTVTQKGTTYFASNEQIDRYVANRPNHEMDNPSPLEPETGTALSPGHKDLAYGLSASTIETLDADMAAKILATLGDETFRREIKARCSQSGMCSGRQVLRALKLKKDRCTNTCNSVMVGYRQEIMDAGPAK